MKSNKRKKSRNGYIVFLIAFICCISIVACSLYYILGHDEYVDDILIEESISPEWLPKGEAETESEPQSETEEEQVALPYGEANNLVFQTLESGLEVQSHGCIYSFLNPEATRKIVPCSIMVQSVLGEQNGTRKQITLSMELRMEGFYEPNGIVLGECITPSISLGDYYTGMVFPDRTLRQNDEISNQVVLSAKEYWQDNIDVEYSYQVEFNNGDWIAGENGVKSKEMTFMVVYTVSIPADYDGLVLRIQPVSNDSDKALELSEELSGDDLMDNTERNVDEEQVCLYYLFE